MGGSSEAAPKHTRFLARSAKLKHHHGHQQLKGAHTTKLHPIDDLEARVRAERDGPAGTFAEHVVHYTNEEANAKAKAEAAEAEAKAEAKAKAEAEAKAKA